MGVHGLSKEAQLAGANVEARYQSPLRPLGDASTSTPMRSGTVGNPCPGLQGSTDHEPPPITLQYITPAGRKSITMPWKRGLSIKHYLREKSLIGLWLRTKGYDKVTKRKVRLGDTVQPGATIVMAPPGAPRGF